MKIREGDRVKFLNDTGGGVVKEIKDSKMAIVLNDDGFEVPVLIQELVRVAGSSGPSDSFARENNIPHNKLMDEVEEEDEGEDEYEYEYHDKHGHEHAGDDKDEVLYISDRAGEEPAPGKPERNLLLGLLENRSKDGLEVWMINDSRFNVMFSVLQKDDLSFLNIRTGHIDPDTKILIRQFSREQINSFITLRFQALFFMRGSYDPVPPSQAEFGLDPVEIYSEGAIGVNDFFDQDAMIVPLISDPHEREVQKIREQDINRLITQKKEGPRPDDRALRRKADPLVEEVDLHIEELVEDHSSLSGREVLDIQMARFTTSLEGALRGKTKRVVFIHGVGNGKLKFEIRKTLDKKYSRLRYQDASFQEYGYGATMVIIRK